MTSVLSANVALSSISKSGWSCLRLCPPVLILLVVASTGASQEAPPGWPTIAALFHERCVMCHSGEHAAVALHLDSYEGAMAGSKNGPVIIPGDIAASELMRRVRGESLPRMPFLSYPLDPDEIALLEHWVEADLPEEKPSRQRSLRPTRILSGR